MIRIASSAIFNAYLFFIVQGYFIRDLINRSIQILDPIIITPGIFSYYTHNSWVNVHRQDPGFAHCQNTGL